MKFFKSKFPAIIVSAVIVAMFEGSVIAAVLYSVPTTVYWSVSSILEGEYSIDDGPWLKTDATKPIDDHFRKIVFKGRFNNLITFFNEIDITFKNVWITLKVDDGTIIYSNTYRIEDSEAVKQMIRDYGEEEYENLLEFDRKYEPMAVRMPYTPGYEHFPLSPEEDLKEYMDQEASLIIENPYSSYYSFSDCVNIVVSDGNGLYLRASRETLLPSTLFLLVCFFGIFLFPTISFILGKINYKYLTFGILCFFWGIFMIMRFQSWILNCFIPDPVVCMMLERMTLMFFFASLAVYLRTNLSQDISRAISGIAVLLYVISAVISVILHLTVQCDLIASAPYLNLLMGIIILVFTVLLGREAKTDRIALRNLFSWTPMVLTLIIDIVDQYISIPGEHFFIFGFSLSLAAQIVQLVFDLQQQYRRAIHYHQIQKELYEARVSIMTSQIRPHFMYNALTSIAMMCTIDPPTAQEATITFAKYLRENMDSLKQNKPVPFERELDHLKKYLYIEKLRFQDKLNIEYDITVTDFVLPLLSVQPLVENAVKHGVGMKKKGGTVKIATRETDDAYEVIISDDGAGFDPSEKKADDGRSHVGMANTRTRLKVMCKGTIRIESAVGEGTIATITLPKEGQNNEDTVS